jgi:hypothetical protein
VSDTRVYRRVRIDGAPFIQLWCGPCGDTYFVAAGVASLDSGLCLSCEQEVGELEALYGEAFR